MLLYPSVSGKLPTRGDSRPCFQVFCLSSLTYGAALAWKFVPRLWQQAHIATSFGKRKQSTSGSCQRKKQVAKTAAVAASGQQAGLCWGYLCSQVSDGHRSQARWQQTDHSSGGGRRGRPIMATACLLSTKEPQGEVPKGNRGAINHALGLLLKRIVATYSSGRSP